MIAFFPSYMPMFGDCFFSVLYPIAKFCEFLITAIFVLTVVSLKLQPYAFRWNSNRNHGSYVSLI